MSSKIKIGIIGCGRAAELIYVPAINKVSDIEVTGVVDPIKERREILSQKFNGCNQFDSIDKNFIDCIDAAIISSTPDTHVKIAAALIYSNKYVLVEKPLALSVDEASELAELGSSSKNFLMMGFNHRYWKPVIEISKKLSDGIKINLAEIIFTGNYSKWNPVAFKSDSLNDLGPHVFDLIRFIFNTELISVSARSVLSNNFELKVRIQENILVQVFISHSTRTSKIIKVFSDMGNYFLSLGSERINPEPGNNRLLLDFSDKVIRKLVRKTSPMKKTYESQLSNFINCIRSGSNCQPGLHDGMCAVAAVESTWKSINNNEKEIFLDEIK
jgi:predicted dehydrogenase